MAKALILKTEIATKSKKETKIIEKIIINAELNFRNEEACGFILRIIPFMERKNEINPKIIRQTWVIENFENGYSPNKNT